MLTWARIILITAMAGGVPALSSCGATHPAASSATQSTASSSMPQMTASPTPAGGAPVATGTVAIKNFAFGPASVTVPVGTTVTWTNDDSEAHTVTAPKGPPHSPPLPPGGTFTYRFTKPGTYSYLCTIHPYMHGTVVVTR